MRAHAEGDELYGDIKDLAKPEPPGGEPEPEEQLPGEDGDYGDPVTFHGIEDQYDVNMSVPINWASATPAALCNYLEQIHPTHLLAAMSRPEMVATIKWAIAPGSPPVDKEWNMFNLYQAIYGGWGAEQDEATRSRLIVMFLKKYANRDIVVEDGGSKQSYNPFRYLAGILTQGETLR